MKKKMILRGVYGFPIGITIGYFITILISLIFADGYYSSCEPELISVMGNEIKAVLLQALLCGLLGSGFAVSSMIWEIDHWNIITQTGIYFLVISVIMMPIAYFLYWMEHSVKGFLSYFSLFALIFAVIWMIQYAVNRQNVKKMNAGLDKTKRNLNK